MPDTPRTVQDVEKLLPAPADKSEDITTLDLKVREAILKNVLDYADLKTQAQDAKLAPGQRAAAKRLLDYAHDILNEQPLTVRDLNDFRSMGVKVPAMKREEEIAVTYRFLALPNLKVSTDKALKGSRHDAEVLKALHDRIQSLRMVDPGKAGELDAWERAAKKDLNPLLKREDRPGREKPERSERRSASLNDTAALERLAQDTRAANDATGFSPGGPDAPAGLPARPAKRRML